MAIYRCDGIFGSVPKFHGIANVLSCVQFARTHTHTHSACLRGCKMQWQPECVMHAPVRDTLGPSFCPGGVVDTRHSAFLHTLHTLCLLSAGWCCEHFGNLLYGYVYIDRERERECVMKCWVLGRVTRALSHNVGVILLYIYQRVPRSPVRHTSLFFADVRKSNNYTTRRNTLQKQKQKTI